MARSLCFSSVPTKIWVLFLRPIVATRGALSHFLQKPVRRRELLWIAFAMDAIRDISFL
jgi:hypothetical protein